MNLTADSTRHLYLDHAATSWPKPPRVVDAMTMCLAKGLGNPNRAGHSFSVHAENIVRDVRVKLARLFNAPDASRVVLTFNCTDALNIAIKGCLSPGDHVVTTVLEHNSVSRPLERLAADGVVTFTRLSIGQDGWVDPDDVRRSMTARTRLITLTHASNVTGVIQPAREVGEIARAHDCLLLLDAAQTAGVVEIDMAAMNVDLLAFPGHKSLLGPTGTGGLCVGRSVTLRAWREGGTGGDSIRPTQPIELPAALEAGTPNTLGLAGLSAALDGLDPSAALRQEQSLIQRLVDSLSDVPTVQFIGDPSPHRRVGVIAFNVHDLAPVDAAAILDESFHIAVRPGLHCAPYAHRALGTFPDGAVRVSVGWNNTLEEVDRFLAALQELTG